MGSSSGVSDRKWGDVDEADYADADEYCTACLIDLNESGERRAKDRCKLPVYEPKKLGGRLNRNAVHAAGNHLVGGRGGVKAPEEAERKAARKLMQLYRQIGDEAPESLRELAR
ncbi:MAG: hypothetical protein ABR564_08770 [Candidatus Dormibacteria bacterium]